MNIVKCMWNAMKIDTIETTENGRVMCGQLQCVSYSCVCECFWEEVSRNRNCYFLFFHQNYRIIFIKFHIKRKLKLIGKRWQWIKCESCVFCSKNWQQKKYVVFHTFNIFFSLCYILLVLLLLLLLLFPSFYYCFSCCSLCVLLAYTTYFKCTHFIHTFVALSLHLYAGRH